MSKTPRKPLGVRGTDQGSQQTFTAKASGSTEQGALGPSGSDPIQPGSVYKPTSAKARLTGPSPTDPLKTEGVALREQLQARADAASVALSSNDYDILNSRRGAKRRSATRELLG